MARLPAPAMPAMARNVPLNRGPKFTNPRAPKLADVQERVMPLAGPPPVRLPANFGDWVRSLERRPARSAPAGRRPIVTRAPAQRGAPPGPAPGGGADAWITEAMRITGRPASEFGALRARMMQESGGNPRAINLWDSNARAGIPSKGLFQTIDPTFQAYRDPRLPNNVYDPVANAVAAINYMVRRYGGPTRLPRGGY